MIERGGRGGLGGEKNPIPHHRSPVIERGVRGDWGVKRIQFLIIVVLLSRKVVGGGLGGEKVPIPHHRSPAIERW